MVEFLHLEDNQNKKNINSLLKVMDIELTNVANITKDYSMWDDTYTFIQDNNKDYIYDNFREGTATLVDLELDGVLFVNRDSQVVYSTYASNILKDDNKELENRILKDFSNKEFVNTFYRFKDNVIYLSKSQILKSDKTGAVQGYMYSLKHFSKEHLSFINTMFESVKIDFNKHVQEQFSITLNDNLKSKVEFDLADEAVYSFIDIFDNERYVFSLYTANDRHIVEHGKENVYIFNGVVFLMLIIISLILFRNQKLIENQNILLDLKVKKRTRQLEKAFRQLKSKNKELYTLANIDSLTKIRNRGSYFIKSEKLLSEAIQSDKELSILMMDIDHFKKINDTYGHAIGDQILIAFCTTINELIDETDIFGRIGGEEFCITFFDKNLNDVHIISEKIRSKCESLLLEIDHHKIQFTVSMGLHARDNLDTIDKILQKSDELLYQAKNRGRNCLIRSSR